MFGENFRKSFISIFLLSAAGAFAAGHPADPSPWLSRFIIYGDNGISHKALKVLSTEGVFGGGTVTGTDWDRFDVLGPVEVQGDFDAERSNSNTFGGEWKIQGNITNGCTGTQSWDNCATWTKNIVFSGTWPYANKAAADNGIAVTHDPGLIVKKEGLDTTYTYVVTPGTNDCIASGGKWSGAGCPVAGQSLSVPLPPGDYDEVSIQTSEAKYEAGVYQIRKLSFTDGTLQPNGLLSGAARFLISEPVAYPWISGSYNVGFYSDTSANYGKTLVYYDGTTKMSFPSGSKTVKKWDATLFAPKAIVEMGTNFAMHGQILAKQVIFGEDITLDADAFVPFDNTSTLSFLSSNSNWVTEGDSIKLYVQKTGETDQEVSFKYRVVLATAEAGDWAETTDFRNDVLVSGSSTFPAGKETLKDSFFIWTKQDLILENNEKFRIEIYDIVGTAATDDIVQDFYIIDDDDSVLNFSISDDVVTEGDSATLTVTVNGLREIDFTAEYQTLDSTAQAGIDYTELLAGSLSFPMGTNSVFQLLLKN